MYFFVALSLIFNFMLLQFFLSVSFLFLFLLPTKSPVLFFFYFILFYFSFSCTWSLSLSSLRIVELQIRFALFSRTNKWKYRNATEILCLSNPHIPLEHISFMYIRSAVVANFSTETIIAKFKKKNHPSLKSWGCSCHEVSIK